MTPSVAYAVIDDGIHDPVVDYSDGTVTIDHTVFELPAGDSATGDRYGYSVDIDGDHAVIGAPAENEDKGSAYIFKRDGGWSQQSKLTASDATVYDQFGHSVSISGDYAIVGAPFADVDHGLAYIFIREGSTWTEQAILQASDGEPYDEFGTSVAIFGEYAVVGAYAADDYAGSAYVFQREGSTWTELAKLTASDRMSYGSIDYFGWSVAMDGDYISVGAWGVGLPDDDYGGIMEAGAVYLFKRDGAAWNEQAKITQRPTDLNGVGIGYRFGYSVSIDDPYVIVGGPGQDYEVVSHGEAYVFKRRGEIWTHTATLTATNPQEYDYFGASVAIDNDHALVGAPYVGRSVYLYARGQDGWTLNDTLTFGETAVDDRFGTSVTLSGSYGVVGAPGDYWSDYPGAAYAYLVSRVNISAANEQIFYGDSTTLSWSFVGATSVTIDNGIGQVSENGSIGVSPAQTTTYTITAVGPWGTFTDSVTVYILPTVQISASAAAIIEGESATLSWTSTLADACEISPDIGPVDLSGSTAVAPTQTTTYTITASNAGGQTTATVTINVNPRIVLEINSPYNDEWIMRPDVMVQGTFSHATGNETGINVNGAPALVYEGQFVANHVPLVEGENTIIVTATDNQGYTTTAEIIVYAQIPEDYIRIAATIEYGVSPFGTELEVEGTFVFDQEPTISVNGPDDVDFLDSLGDDRYNVGMTAPGIYFINAEVTDEETRVYTDNVALMVLDLSIVDAMLTAKWNGMKEQLSEGNIDGALEFFSDLSREQYNEIFTVLSSDLADIAAGMEDIELIYLKEYVAKYRIGKNETINGDVHRITYYIYFVRDPYGLWYIEGF